MEGIYIYNKEEGRSSYDIVRDFKKRTSLKVGHAGTLDPFATGLLIVLVGRATKLSHLLLNEEKVYEGIITFGSKTDSYDKTGNIVKELKDFNIREEELHEAITKLSGKITQTPPIYSSIKVKGKKLYQYARKNEAVVIPNKEVYVEFLHTTLKGHELFFKVKVSKGTYIRSLANDLGDLLNIPSHLSSLNRLQSGSYTLDDGPFIDLKEFASTLERVDVEPYLMPLISNGVRLDSRQTTTKNVFSVYCNDKLLAIYEPAGSTYKPIIIFGDDYETLS